MRGGKPVVVRLYHNGRCGCGPFPQVPGWLSLRSWHLGSDRMGGVDRLALQYPGSGHRERRLFEMEHCHSDRRFLGSAGELATCAHGIKTHSIGGWATGRTPGACGTD